MSTVSLERAEERYAPGLLSPSDRMLLDGVRDFVRERVIPVRRELEAGTRAGRDDYQELLARMVPLGLQGCALPEEYGGSGINSALTLAVLAEELGRGDASLGISALAAAPALLPAVRAGNAEVMGALAPRLCGGIPFTGSLALEEDSAYRGLEESGMLRHDLRARASLSGDRWRIEGRKVRVANAGREGFLCVACRDGEAGGKGGIALIYAVFPGQGMAVSEGREMAGLRGARLGDVLFEGAELPSGFRAAGPQQEEALLLEALALSRVLTSALAAGAARGALEGALDFTRERPAAGKPIRQHSVCAALLADAAASLQAARDGFAAAAAFIDGNRQPGLEGARRVLARASLAKLSCCRAAVEVVNRAMELMGSYGYVSDYHIEKYWRDIKVLQLLEGGTLGARLDAAHWHYPFERFCRNQLYEEMQRRRRGEEIQEG